MKGKDDVKNVNVVTVWLRRARPYLLGLLIFTLLLLYVGLSSPLPVTVRQSIIGVVHFLLRALMVAGAIVVQSPVLALLYDVWMGLLIVYPAVPMVHGQIVQMGVLVQLCRPLIATHKISPARMNVLERRWRCVWRGWMRDAHWLYAWIATIRSLFNLRQFVGIAFYMFPSNRSLQTVSA